jgi:hypothetical protein
MALQKKTVHLYFTESCKKFTVDATFTDGRSVSELSLEIQTELFRWYFTESCEIFTTYATITDGLAVGELLLEIQTDYFVDTFLTRNVFFLLALSVCTTVNLFFLLTEVVT